MTKSYYDLAFGTVFSNRVLSSLVIVARENQRKQLEQKVTSGECDVVTMSTLLDNLDTGDTNPAKTAYIKRK